MRQLNSNLASSRTRAAAALSSLLCLWLLPEAAEAHDLAVDELRLWVPPAGNELRGQLTFDPELTRSLDAELADDVKRRQVTEFVARQIVLNINGRSCTPVLSVRELYERGGATAGDVVMLACAFRSPAAALDVRVTVGDAFPALFVQGVGMTGSPNESALEVKEPLAGVATLAGGSSLRLHRDLTPLSASGRASGLDSVTQLAGAFFRRGLGHVLPSGVDHLLFAAAITLGTYRELRRLSALLALFTLSHTLAVAWVAKGLWPPPSELIEPCIAASIAVAGYGAFRGVSWLHAAPLIGLFGLVHGLGFANGVAGMEADLPSFLVSVVAFNLGVEAGQGVVVLAVLGVLYAFALRAIPTARGSSWAALCIAATGAVWTVLRLWP